MIRLFILVLLGCIPISGYAIIDSTSLISVTPSIYKRLEIGIATDASITLLNSYDAAQVDMYGVFVSPNGQKYYRPAFHYTGYHRCNDCATDVLYKPGDPDYRERCDKGWRDVAEHDSPDHPHAYLRPTGSSFPWHVRFAPPDSGLWT
ncbi:MAG: hypothetical protein EOP49_04125, partial [Sphingobacteriales bacterium]